MQDDRQELSFPFASPAPYEPPTEYAKLRADEPVVRVVLPTGDHAWLVSRYEDVRTVLADSRFSRAATTRPGAARLRPLPPDRSTILAMDPPEHTRMRRLVSGAFSPRRVERLRPRIEQITADLLATLAEGGPPADLMEEFALPLPLTVICELLGVPLADRSRFRSWTDRMLTMTGGGPAEVRAAREKMTAYLDQLVAEKRRDPGDDLMSALVAARDGSDRLSEDELVQFGSTLLIAGYHTTSTALASIPVLLTRHPDTAARLRERPGLLPGVIEELLRYSAASASGGNIRIAVAPVELAGHTIQPGDAVLPAIVSANRDCARFAEPDRFKPDRGRGAHLAFGLGAHFCLGAELARTELRVALGALVTDFPRLRLSVPETELGWDNSAVIRRPSRLPVTW